MVQSRTGGQVVEVTFTDVGKCYGERWAVRNITLTLRQGIVGLLGPNGAGKTTLMSMLTTLARPSTGSITWDGVDIHRSPERLRSRLGYLPQDFGVYPYLTPVEFLEYLAAAKGLAGRAARSRIGDLLEALNLTGAARRPLATLSGGTRQRVGIAQALLNDPDLLVLDEPTTGLDPEERVRFRQLLADLRGERLVILSTHVVSDVESIAGELVLVREGQLVAHTTVDELLGSVAHRVWEVAVSPEQAEEMRRRLRIRALVQRGGSVRLQVLADEPPAADARPVPPTLEDAYMYSVTAALGGEAACG